MRIFKQLGIKRIYCGSRRFLPEFIFTSRTELRLCAELVVDFKGLGTSSFFTVRVIFVRVDMVLPKYKHKKSYQNYACTSYYIILKPSATLMLRRDVTDDDSYIFVEGVS